LETASEATIMRGRGLSKTPLLNRILRRLPLISQTQSALQQAAMKITVGGLLMISLASALLAFLVTSAIDLPFLLKLPACLGAAAIPFGVVAYKRHRRISKFEELFSDAIDLLARAVRVGHPITTGFELIATEMSEPVAGEFRLVFDQQNLGLPIRDALQNLCLRMPLADVKVFVTVLQIQRETGGNLSEILENVADVIRERFKLYRQVRVLTAEGRMSMGVLMAIPPIAAVLFYLTNPEYMMPLFTEALGTKLIGLALIMQTLGCLVIRRIIRIKV
jgi:tight adherence protein B